MGSISFMTIRREPTVSAVTVQNAYKNYSTKPGSKPIINNLTMNVQRGKIYSLLGSSGCGKTTLLSCVIGVRSLDTGIITVFGRSPGEPGSGVPGRRLGFMPQEIALHGEFSISEELHYFGKIFGMSYADVEDNKKFLINFLKLPPADRRIGSLSGGQQRRVSFASALVHNPELLILDEPTVGVDPLLRRSIWSHLVKLANSGTSIIITTHFIEEARDSHRIGLMRNGRILMEETPLVLMKKYNTNILEEVVVELCLKDKSEEDTERDIARAEDAQPFRVHIAKPPELLVPEKSNTRALVLSASALPTGALSSGSTAQPQCEPLQVPTFGRWPDLATLLHKAKDVEQQATDAMTKTEKYQKGSREGFERISALLYKNMLVLARNMVFVIFLIVQPAFQISLVCLAIGPDPHGITLGIVNEEAGNGRDCKVLGKTGCMMSSAAKYNTMASCEFIKSLNPKVFGLVEYQQLNAAIKDVKLGKLYGVMTFPINYTDQLKERLQYGAFASLDVLAASRVEFNLDMSSKQIALLMQGHILQSFQEFMKRTAIGCKFDPEGVDLPVHFGTPVFGSHESSFTEYVAPGVIVAIVYFFPICSTAMAVMMEKCSGTLERTLVAGVRNQEIMIAHFLTQFVVLFIQATLSFLIVFLFFKIEMVGSYALAFLLSLMVGVLGLSFGFFVASICRTELESVLMTLAAFMPNLILSGVIWPLEAMPNYLLIVSYFLPCTIPGGSLRSIISRGSSFFHPTVWPGFASTAAWIIVHGCTALYINKRKSKV